jgi:hypothetical protein
MSRTLKFNIDEVGEMGKTYWGYKFTLGAITAFITFLYSTEHLLANNLDRVDWTTEWETQ